MLTFQGTLSDKTTVKIWIRGQTTTFSASGTKFGLAEVTEQLLWVSTALRLHTNEQCASLNFAQPQGQFTLNADLPAITEHSMWSALHVGTAHCSVEYRSIPVKKLTSGQCWYAMFDQCPIVAGYPTRTRSLEKEGLEIPFDMMAGIIGAERVVPFCDKLIVKGFSMLMFPTHYENECMYWHLICNDDGSRISYADKRLLTMETKPEMAKVRAEDVNHARHFVGWTDALTTITGRLLCTLTLECRSLTCYTGTLRASYNITGSRLQQPSSHLVLEKLQINAGQYITLGTTWAAGRLPKAVNVKDKTDYVGRLEALGRTWVILHDTTVSKAWLVDGLSALLHLVRAYLHKECNNNDYQAARLLLPESLQAKGQGKGRKMAYDTLVDANNRKLRLYSKDGAVYTQAEADCRKDEEFYCLFDAIKEIMHLLEIMIDHQVDERTESSVGSSIRALPWSQLVGYDFIELATKTDPIWPLTATLKADAAGWVQLSRAIHATTLFGRDFDELMEPSKVSRTEHIHCSSCCWNSVVPAHRDILAVSIVDLDRITTHRGMKTDTYWRILDDLYINIRPELFSKCTEKGHRRCHTQRIQSIQRYSGDESRQKDLERKKKPGLLKRMPFLNDRSAGRQQPTTASSTSIDFSEGGVLLGIAPHRLQKNASKIKGLQTSTPRKSVHLMPPLPSTQTSRETSTLYRTTEAQSTNSGTISHGQSSVTPSTSKNISTTEPSDLVSPMSSSEVRSSGGHKTTKARSTSRSKTKIPIRTWV